MRFASHRDIARAVERGVRKAELPVAYSAGFSPHPKISYAGGAPTGTASEAEYLEIAFTRICAAGDIRERLDAALPDGIDVIEVLDPGSAPALEASQWRVVLPGITPEAAAQAAAAFLAADTVPVDRLTSKGTRRLDARAAVVMMELDRRAAQERLAECAILRIVVRHMTPAVRPDEVLAALRRVAGLAPSSPPLVTRLAQGSLGAVTAAPLAGMPGRDVSERGAAQGQEQQTATRSDAAAAAATSPAAPSPAAGMAAAVSAYEQLPRGAEGPDDAGPRAREYDGRLPACSKRSDRTTENQRPISQRSLAQAARMPEGMA